MAKKLYLKTTIKASTEYLSLINKLTLDFLSLLKTENEEAKNISLAVDEALTNTIKHAYKYDDKKDVEIEYVYENDTLTIKIYHTGIPLSPDKLVFPDMKEYLKKYQKGGLGIMLMIKFMDSVEYGNENGKHFCKLVKKIS